MNGGAPGGYLSLPFLQIFIHNSFRIYDQLHFLLIHSFLFPLYQNNAQTIIITYPWDISSVFHVHSITRNVNPGAAIAGGLF